MLGPILAGLILGGLIAFVITFAILKISDIVTRFKKQQETMTRAGEKLDVVFADPLSMANITGISVGELQGVMGSEGLFEVPIINDKVDTDNITVLKSDEQEEKLGNILRSNGGVIKLTA